MAKSPKPEPKPAPPSGYLFWSRDPAVGVFAVLPLWLAYEGLRLFLAPEERNGAEALVTDTLLAFGQPALIVLRALMAVAIAFAAWSILRREVPWGRVALVSMLEGTCYGLLLGPVTNALTVFVLENGRVFLASDRLAADLVSSLGAGIFEEALFRLVLLSLLALALGRLALSLSLPVHTGTVVAVLLSALLFSWFHHIGPGAEPLEAGVFVFRAVAGTLLGALFVLRGFAVCVYGHAVYDLHYYLSS